MSKKRHREHGNDASHASGGGGSSAVPVEIERALERFFTDRVRPYVDKKFRSLRRELDDAVTDAVTDATAAFENAREEHETRADDLLEYEREDERDLRARDDDEESEPKP